jgi:hypothetical protein
VKTPALKLTVILPADVLVTLETPNDPLTVCDPTPVPLPEKLTHAFAVVGQFVIGLEFKFTCGVFVR